MQRSCVRPRGRSADMSSIISTAERKLQAMSQRFYILEKLQFAACLDSGFVYSCAIALPLPSVPRDIARNCFSCLPFSARLGKPPDFETFWESVSFEDAFEDVEDIKHRS